MASIMHEKAVWSVMLALLAFGLYIAPSLAQAPAPGDGDWSPVAIVYIADVGGKIEPCG
ncbi:hypothetical protein KKG45_13340 [bacterium]|nr:hypothetical protein [bacterium]MBU1074225.1 hypothetical protein [bacterium]MBU1675100.1 hypothetical protein [bacterium]